MKAVLPFLAFLASQAGCIPLIKCYHPDYPTRRNVEKSLDEDVDPSGWTTEEVLLRLGEPDRASRDGKTLEYRWTKVCGMMFLPTGLLTDTCVRTLETRESRVIRVETRFSWDFDLICPFP
jgi:hypothetical protein